MKHLVASVLLVSATVQGFFVDPQYKLVEWEGWGTNMYWFGDIVGGFDQRVQDEITSALFSPEKLNLNIVRYVIGAYTPGDQSCNISYFIPGGATESFRDGPNTPFIWNRDVRARKILLSAKALGADTFEAFSLSPPSWLTRNGCINGNSDGAPLHDNFHPDNANTFADYLTEVVKHYKEQHNLSFASLAPVYEPSSGLNAGQLGNQGCNMERSTVAKIIQGVHASLQFKNLSFCTVSAANEVNVDDELETQEYLSAENVHNLYLKVNTNDYSSIVNESRTELSVFSERNGHRLWVAGVRWGSETSWQTMTNGLSIATRNLLNIRKMFPSAYVYQDIVGDIKATMLVRIPYDNATMENIQFSSGYFVLMQFSRFIKKGFTLVQINDFDSLAAYDQVSKTLVIVTTNSGNSSTAKTFDLRSFDSLGTVHAIRTSPVEPHVAVPPPRFSQGQFTFDFPAKSVTTFQILNAVYTQTDNLVRNGDFEGSGNQPWYLMYGSRDDNGINGNYVRHGQNSGFIDFTDSKLSLMQNVTVSFSRTYYLSAWCAATGGSTIFGVLVNGNQGPEVTIESSEGYQLYGLSVDVQRDDVITIFLHSEKGNHTAQIDDVMLH